MAEAAVSMAVEKLGDLLIQKVRFLIGVEEQVVSLKNELKRMQCFLKDATEKHVPNNEMARNWVAEIRDLAQDAEDVIETFNLKIESPRRTRGLLERCGCFPIHVYHLDRLGQEIESIRARLRDIFDSRDKYGAIQDLGHEGTESRIPDIAVQQRRRLLPQRTDRDVVGLEKDIKSLLEDAILNKSRGLLISRITGMGGLGKSTLAREVYNHSAVVAARFDFRAWVVVSEEFEPKEVLKKLVLECVGAGEENVRQGLETLSVEELKRKLFERLSGRRYFIVLDDIWEHEHWELLADAFPDKQGNSSRLLVTSRNRNVPRSAQHVHELKPLDPDMSWQLLLRKSFVEDTNGKCPPQLEHIGREIVERCVGLPLAITVMGGLLLEQRQSQSGWQKILRGMKSLLGRSENSVSAILELSYHSLPPHLKSCFLCLGFFEEDVVIRAEKLIQLWIAECLISQDHGRDETMEDIARGYLDELINRNIVQVKKMTGDQVKSCRVHDLVRELSIKKAEEEIGFNILKEGTNSQTSNKSRHRAIYCSNLRFNLLVSPSNKHVRSLFIHKANYIEGLNFKSFPLLRVLDFDGCGFESLPESIGELIGLKYLGLRGNILFELPSSLGRLKNLQVLNITTKYGGIKVPDVIWKLYNLRHLYLEEVDISGTSMRLDTLKNLQTLVYICYGWWWPEHLMEMTDLRKLVVDVDKSSIDVRVFMASLAKMENLAYLKLRTSFEVPLEGLDTLHSVTELKLFHPLPALPSVDNFPPNLSHLTLFYTDLHEDPMPVLEKLPNLLYLNLKRHTYVGREMVISRDGFPRLRLLRISWLYKLIKIELVGEGHGILPEIKRLEIKDCYRLESIPNKLMTLLEIVNCPNMKTQILEDGDMSSKQMIISTP